jgi:hypothetical protein
MNKNIKEKLDEYLEFDSGYLFRDEYTKIFGGSIRDIIANQKINDIDLLCDTHSMWYIEELLQKNGYTFLEKFNNKEIQIIYKSIRVISEPHTWIKNDKIVQLIRPIQQQNIITVINDLISNVDLTCCSLSYNGELKEHLPNAILHASCKVFSINENAKMITDRLYKRIDKLERRGWKFIKNSISNNRKLKLDQIISF